jgi:hypothetical protein
MASIEPTPFSFCLVRRPPGAGAVIVPNPARSNRRRPLRLSKVRSGNRPGVGDVHDGRSMGRHVLSKEEVCMVLAVLLPLAKLHGAAVPVLWIIGLILIIAGVISLFRGGLLIGILLIIIGVVLGGLNIF